MLSIFKLLKRGDKAPDFITFFINSEPKVRSQILMSDVILQACVHEAGHLLMAEVDQLKIGYVQLNDLCANYGVPGPAGNITSHVEVSDYTPGEAIRYWLGGICAEVLITQTDAGSAFNYLALNPSYWVSDLKNIIEMNQYKASAYPPATIAVVKALHQAIARGQRGERLDIVRTTNWKSLPEFQVIADHEDRLRSLATDLHRSWSANGFNAVNLRYSRNAKNVFQPQP
jgi:hypothetical protein